MKAALLAGSLALAAHFAAGAIVIDGDVSDWPEASRIHPPFYQTYDPVNQEALFMIEENGYLYFLMKPRTGSGVDDANRFAFIDGSSVFLNTDQDTTTGYSGPSWAPPGLDFTIAPRFEWWPPGAVVNGVHVYKDCIFTDGSCYTPLFSLDAADYAVINDASNLGRGIELRVSKSKLESYVSYTIGDIDVSVYMRAKTDAGVVQTEVIAPASFLNWYSFYPETLTLPACNKPSGSQRAAVIFSNDALAKFFQDKAYSQLYGTMQYQLFQAGIPHDRKFDTDLVNFAEMCKYDFLVMPFAAFAKLSEFGKLKKAIFTLVHIYGVGVITTGNFLTNDASTGWSGTLPGNPYYTMSTLLGIDQNYPVFAETSGIVVSVTDNTNLFTDKSVGYTLYTSDVIGTFTNMYIPTPNTVYTVNQVAKQTLTINGAQSEYNAILLSHIEGANMFGKDSGPCVHFATLEMLANTDLVWRAARYIVTTKREVAGEEPLSAGLVLSRDSHLLTFRVDCDQSQYAEEAVILTPYMIEHWTQHWYDTYNFVGSYYVNIGNSVKDGEYTDWNLATSWYNQILGMESEIGSHSYTHPHNISDPAVNLQFEFGQSTTLLMQKLSLPRCAAAQPGATEELWVAKEMEQYLSSSYFSGGYSGIKAGYPGVFGYLDPNSDMVYVAPNMYFDFTCMGWLQLTAAETATLWKQQLEDTAKNANQMIVHWPGHDYAAGNWGYGPNDNLDPAFNQGPGYTLEMFEDVIAEAANMGTEFLTTLDLSDRIRAHAAELTVTQVSSTELTVTVTPKTGHKVGNMAIEPFHDGSSSVIQNAGNHYAYNDRLVFLPENGGSFTVNVGSSSPSQADKNTHVSKLPMRAILSSVNGNGAEVTVTFTGRGTVVVDLNPNLSFASYAFSNSTSATVSADSTAFTVAFNFDTYGTHTATVSLN